ncbi:MAG: hypothetical protein MUO26_04660 [Methanotrichaceae archaeon]|nr:hypothetical protein [Methanotrichaceae archaeon]
MNYSDSFDLKGESCGAHTDLDLVSSEFADLFIFDHSMISYSQLCITIEEARFCLADNRFMPDECIVYESRG